MNGCESGTRAKFALDGSVEKGRDGNYMNLSPVILGAACISIGLLNVLLNIAIKTAADQVGGYWNRMFSSAFLLAFVVGIVSLVSIFSLYSLKVDLGRAILLMGAASIVGGALISIIFFGSELKIVEAGILMLISALYVVRIFGK